MDVEVDIETAERPYISVHCKNQWTTSSPCVVVVGGGGGGLFVVGGGGGGGRLIVVVDVGGGGGGGGLFVVVGGGGGGGRLIVVVDVIGGGGGLLPGLGAGPEQISPLGQHPMTPLLPKTQYVLQQDLLQTNET